MNRPIQIFGLVFLIVLVFTLLFNAIFYSRVLSVLYWETNLPIFYELLQKLPKPDSSDLKANQGLIQKYRFKKREILKPENKTNTDAKLLLGFSYLVKGEEGLHEYEVVGEKLLLSNFSKRRENDFSIWYKPPFPNETYIGGASDNSVKKEIEAMFEDLKGALLSRDKDAILDIINNSYDETIEYDVNLVKNLLPEEVIFLKENNSPEAFDDLEVAEVKVLMPNCYKHNYLNVQYSVEKKIYYFGNVQEFLASTCSISQPEVVIEANCIDCRYFPVDKKFKLSQNYLPPLKAIDFAGNDKQIHIETYNELKKLFEAAQSEGYWINITSAYRSYQNQQATFQYWVSIEIARGNDPQTAELNANTYSAKAGHSEHQLGTTLDMNAVGCNFTERICPDNKALWAWLDANAHKYGFVMSYPKLPDSSYIHEPWHWRWIGVEKALEYYKFKDKLLLRDWLINEAFYLGM